MRLNDFCGRLLSFFFGQGRRIRIVLAVAMTVLSPALGQSQEFSVKGLGDFGNVTVMEVTGNYDAHNADGTFNALARAAITKEYLKSHKDEYDFFVFFTNFDFAMPDPDAKGFYQPVKNDIKGIGADIFDHSLHYGSDKSLQGIIEMGNLARKVTTPLDPGFNDTLLTLSHEMMHRWGVYVKFRDTNGADSTALLGSEHAHWSFLFDSNGSVLYGNRWQNLGGGMFTSVAPMSEMKAYSPLDLYLMGLIGPEKVGHMLLIDSPGTDPERLPEAGVTITGTARTITIQDVIAASGLRDPAVPSSPKSFNTAFVYLTRPGTFRSEELVGIENIRNSAVTRFSIMTDGSAIMRVGPMIKDDVPVNPGTVQQTTTPRAVPPDLQEGLTWLMNKQQADGRWEDSPQTADRDTAVSAVTLKSFELSLQNFRKGLQWLALSSSGNVDYLARRIVAAIGTAVEGAALLTTDLISMQNHDGGWGSGEHYGSSNADTALALLALRANGHSDPAVIARAIAYIKANQNGDGSWGSEDRGGMVQETARALAACSAYRTNYALEEAIAKGSQWLIAKQNADGGFGNSPSTVYDTAVALMALTDLGMRGPAVRNAMTYLYGRQSGTGSWDESVYETALAVAALYRASVDPDLSVTAANISFIPGAVKTIPSNIVVSAEIWNTGRQGVPQAKVALYDGAPASGRLIGEQVLAFPGQQPTMVTFSAPLADGNPHTYSIVIDPDDQVNESDETNNSAGKELQPEATYDFEIIASDVQVSQNPASLLQDVTISAKITNKGTLNASQVRVRYFIDDPAGPVEIGNETVELSGGMPGTVDLIWRPTRAGSDLPVTIVVDPLNEYEELSETDNQAAVPVTVIDNTIEPDLSLALNDITFVPATITSLPASAVLEARVWNTGKTAVPLALIALYEGDAAAGNKLGEQAVAVPGQGSTVVSFPLSIPTAEERRYTLIVDHDNRVSESNEANNSVIKVLPVAQTYDLEILPGAITLSPGTADAFDDVVVTSLISNKGTQTAYNVQIRSFLDLAGSPIEIATQTVTVPANGSISNSVVWKADRWGVDMPVRVNVDPLDRLAELSETNNSASLPLTVHAPTVPNLTVSFQDIQVSPAKLSQRGSGTITALIRNDGFVASTPVMVDVYSALSGTDRIPLGTVEIPAIDPGQGNQISVAWNDIPVSGKREITFVIDPQNSIPEMSKTDNTDFVEVDILSLPDLRITTSSITLAPQAPKDGDIVQITVSVQNSGEQTAANVAVQISDDLASLGTLSIPSIESGATKSATVSFDTKDRKGAHTITANVDPENAIVEQSKENNIASRTFSVQDGNLYVTEPYFSPNGDGVKDSTQFFFRFAASQTVTVVVLDDFGNVVRTFAGSDLSNITAGTITWDGFNQQGTVVRDGAYRLEIRALNGSSLAGVEVVVDNNRSTLTEALGTPYFYKQSILLPSGSYQWLSDDTGFVVENGRDQGVFMFGFDGSLEKISPAAWFGGDYHASSTLTEPGPDSNMIAVGYNAVSYTETTTDRYGNLVLADGNWFGQLHVYNRDTGQWNFLDEARVTLTRTIDNIIQTYTTGSIDRIWWSPDGKKLAYEKRIEVSTWERRYELWVTNLDGTGRIKIDEGDDGFEAKWSPTNDTLAFTNRTANVWVSDMNGNLHEILINATVYSDGFEWASTGMLLLYGFDGTLWKVDPSDPQNPVLIAQDIHAVNLTPQKNKAVLFHDGPTGRMSVLDLENYETLFDADAPFDALHLYQESWNISTNNAYWSGDGARFTAIGYGVGYNYLYSWYAVFLDLERRTSSNILLSIDPYWENSYYGAFWLDDNATVLFAGSRGSLRQNVTATFNTLTGEWADLSDTLPMKALPGYSPRRTYLYNQTWNPGTWNYSLETYRSLLNLTADLRPSKQKTSLLLNGTVADLNFDRYKLEYADSGTSATWHAVQPPSGTPVVNDLLATWVPPHPGIFYLRLTTMDKAGNSSSTRKRVSWSASSSITGLYKSLEIFSPNGDKLKDTVELHYKVLDPVHLEFTVSDDQERVVRTFTSNHAAPEESFISWDGTDTAGRVVPDGKYRISVLDYSFFVELDTTPPDVHLKLESVVSDKEKQAVTSSLSGYAVDNNISTWTVEFEEDSNPGAWSPFKQGLTSFTAKDQAGTIIYPYSDTVVDRPGWDLGFYRGKKFRLTAEDLAGNRVSSTTGYLEEGLFLYTTKIDLGGGPLGTSMWVDDMLSERREHELRRAVTTRHSLAALNLQYKINGSWTDGPALPQPDASSLHFPWDNTSLDRKITFIRLKGEDVLGQVFYSNELSVMPLFTLSFDCRIGLIAGILTDNKMSIVKFQIKGPGDHQWTDYFVLSGIEAEYYSGYPRMGYPPSGVTPGVSYQIRMTGVDKTGKPYESNVLSYPQTCAVTMKLRVLPEEASCGSTSSGKTVLEAYDIKPSGPVSFKTLSYYVELPSGPQLVKAFDLTQGFPGSATFDTNSTAEGTYTATAVLSYLDRNKGTLEEIAESATLYVDRQLPTANITYPAASTVLCPIKNTSPEGDWYGVSVEGLAADATGVAKYDLSYGIGDDPATWTQATTDTGKSRKAIAGAGPVTGSIGTWNVTTLKDSAFSLKLRAVDVAGNTSCAATVVNIKSLPEITALSIDRKLISPDDDGNNDQVAAFYQLDGYAALSLRVHRLVAQGNTYVPDATPIRTVQENVQYLGGQATATWDGRNDGGTAVSDGKYAILLVATDSCGNSVQKWVPVEVDSTPPAVRISYPQPQQPVGTVVEVTGTADDIHFSNYDLEAGEGSAPETWSSISTGSKPVKEAILGTWNTFGRTGEWTLRLTAFDKAGNRNEETSLVSLGTRTSLIRSLSSEPAVISPNNDGRSDSASIRYELTDTCDVSIEIVDAGGAVRKSHEASALATGFQSAQWDGTDANGIVLTDGVYKIRLTARLSALPEMNQVETVTAVIDSTPPGVNISQPVNDSYTRNDLTIAGDITDANLSEYAVALTGPEGIEEIDTGNQTRENYAFGILTGLPDGAYTVTVSTKDTGENVTARNIVFVVDKTAPVVSLASGTNGGYYGGRNLVADIVADISEENLAGFTLRYGQGEIPSDWTSLMNGTSVPAVQPLYAWMVGPNDGIPDGKYTVSLQVIDKAGAASEAKALLTVDNTSPLVSLATPHDGDSVKQPVELKGTAFDANLEKYSLEVSEGECDSAFKWAPLRTSTTGVEDGTLAVWQSLPSDGDYCLKLTASDKSGNTAETKVNVRVDTHAPGAPVLSGAIANRSEVNLTWTPGGETDIAGYTVYRNGQKLNQAFITATGYVDQSVADGIYAYSVTAIDNAGWESIPSNKVEIKIDASGPEARITSPPDGSRVSSLADIKGTAFSVSDFRHYRLYIGQGQNPAWSLIRTSPLPITYGVLAEWDTAGVVDGDYSIRLEAEDLSGNVNIHQVTVTIDNTPPARPVLLTAGAEASDATLAWQANSEPDLAGYLIYRNGQLANANGLVIGDLRPYGVQGTAYLDRSVPDGSISYYLVAIDSAGNMSDHSNSRDVRIDTRSPHATIADPASGSRFGGSIAIKAESPDLDIASVQFQYQGVLETTWTAIGGPAAGAVSMTYLDPVALGLVHGDYRLRAVATDNGGKADPDPGFITVTYADLTPPLSPQGLTAAWNNGVVTVTWNPNAESDLEGYNLYRTEGTSRTRISVIPVPANGQPRYQDAVPDGTYAYDATAVDISGNESRPSSQAGARIYTPVISQPYTPSAESSIGLLGSNGGPLSIVSFFAETASGAVPVGTATADGSGSFGMNVLLAAGENRIFARAADTSGNVSRDAEKVIVVYNTAPTAPLDLAASVDASSVHLAWTANSENDLLGYNIYRDGVIVNRPDALVLSQALTSASSSFSFSNGPETAVDSSPDTYWMPQDGTSTASPAWWEADLGSSVLLSRIDIRWGTDTDASGNQSVYAGRDYEIQAWSGHAWITRIKVSGNEQKDNSFDLEPPYRTDRIRVVITDSTDQNSSRQVRLAEVSVVKDNPIPATAQPAYDDLDLLNKGYEYAVTAVDIYGLESLQSPNASATIAVAPPDQPANLVVMPTQDGALSLSWFYNGTVAAGFNLYRSTTSGGTFAKINTSPVSGTDYLDRGLTMGVSYYYVIAAVDAIGNQGLYSNEAFGIPQDLAAPAKPSLFFPTFPGIPITIPGSSTSVSGSADPGVFVDLMVNQKPVSRAVAQTADTYRSIPLDYDQQAAAISPDGKTLAYTFYYQVIVLKSLSTGVETVAVEAPWCYALNWSADGSKLVYGFYDYTWTARIGVYDLKTGTGSIVASDPNSAGEMHPSLSPDGTKVLFVRQSWWDSPEIRLLDLVSGTDASLVYINMPYGVKFSSDGKRFSYFEGMSLNVYDLSTGLVQTIDSDSNGSAMEWSPDGRQLAFVSNRNGSGDVYVVSLDRMDQTLIPGSSYYPYNLGWTADGRFVLFDIWNDQEGKDYIWMANVGTVNMPARVMPHLYSVYPAGSSRNGTIFYINADQSGSFTLQMMDPKGMFSFPAVSLDPGENTISAIAVDQAGNGSAPAEAIVVTSEGAAAPVLRSDLAVGIDDVSLYPPAPVAGEQTALNANIRNTGNTDIANVSVLVYVWNALGQLEFLNSETIPALSAGATSVISATWDSTGKAGATRLVVVVDPYDGVVEADETNNMAVHDFFVADHAGVTLSLVTDAPHYQPRQNADVSVTVRNNGPMLSNGRLTVRIEDAAGYPVTTFDPAVINIEYASEAVKSFTWNVGTIYAGSYTVRAVLHDVAGLTLTEQALQVTVVSDAGAGLTVATDKIGYGPNETVKTSFTIRNNSSNAVAHLIQAVVLISDPTGSVLYREEKSVSNLLPGVYVEENLFWSTALHAPGQYTVRVEVSDGETPIAESAVFSIESSLIITGTLTLPLRAVPLGGTVELTYLLANTGNTDAIGYAARISIVDPETQAVMAIRELPLTLARNTEQSGQVAVSTSGYGLRTYTAVLHAISPTSSATIAGTSFTVMDLAAPTVDVIQPVAQQVYGPSVPISVTAWDDASGMARVEYRIDDGFWSLMPAADPSEGRYAATWSPSPSDNSLHTISFRATDNAGNASTPVPVSFFVDTIPPVLAITSLPDGSITNNDTANIAGTAADNRAVQSVTVNDLPVTVNPDGSFSQALKLVPGPNSIKTTAKDIAGNITTDIRTIVLELTAPVITITSPADNSITNDTSLIITGTVDQPATVSIRMNGTPVPPEIVTSGSFTFSVALDYYGQNLIEVIAVDSATNTSTAKRTVTFDNVNPALALTYPVQDISTNQASVLLQGTVSDLSGLTITVAVEGDTYTPEIVNGTFEQQLNFTVEKQYKALVTATDAAGNTSTAERNIIYDKTPPAVSVDPVQTPTNNTQQLVQGTIEQGATVTISCPTAMVGVVSYPSPTTWQVILAGMTEGENNVTATAEDATHNVSGPVTAVIVLDTQAPDTAIMDGPLSLTNISTGTIMFTSGEAGASFACRLDTGEYTACTSPVLYSYLSEGFHIFQVRAIDQTGNSDQTPAAWLWTVDTVPPVAVVTGIPTSPTKSASALITIQGNDVTTYRYSLDNGIYSNEIGATLPLSLSELADGVHTLSVIGRDSIGNWQAEASATVASWTVDLTPPALTLSTLPDQGVTNNGTLNIAGTVTDNVAVQSLAVNDTPVPWNPDGSFSFAWKLVTGSNTIVSRAEDTAGNTTTDTRTIVLDQTAPVITITNPADNSLTNYPELTVTGFVDKPAIVNIKVNGNSTLPEVQTGYSFTFPVTLAYGQNTIEIRAVDQATNSSIVKRTIMLDNVNPALAVTNPGQDISINQTGILLQGTVDDLTGITVTITYDTTTYTPAVTNGTFQQELSFAGEKQYPVVVTAMDAAGNSSTVQRNVIYDKTPPGLTIDPVKTPTSVSQQIVTGTMERGSVITVTCPTAEVGEVTYPSENTWRVIVASMDEWENTITATATDKTGNLSNPVQASILLDTYAPATTISPAPGIYTTPLSVTLSSNEVAKIYYSTDGTTPTQDSTLYSAPIPVSVTTTISYFAVGPAGNKEAVKQATYTIDAGAKGTTLKLAAPSFVAQGGSLKLSAQLVTEALAPIAGQSVNFTLSSGSSSQSCSGSTDRYGSVSCTIKRVVLGSGEGLVSAAFSGSASYQPSMDSRNIIIYGYPAKGSFVIADNEAKINNSVLFWGSQWSKKNDRHTKGTASFKGFADTANRPITCGGTWSGRTGNSRPPAAVSAYMAVIASNEIEKSRGTIFGHVTRIVIVKVDPGYAPDPEHPGTGIVVGSFCTDGEHSDCDDDDRHERDDEDEDRD